MNCCYWRILQADKWETKLGARVLYARTQLGANRVHAPGAGWHRGTNENPAKPRDRQSCWRVSTEFLPQNKHTSTILKAWSPGGSPQLNGRTQIRLFCTYKLSIFWLMLISKSLKTYPFLCMQMIPSLPESHRHDKISCCTLIIYPTFA